MSERERYRVPNQGGRMSTNEPMTPEQRNVIVELLAEVKRLRARLTVDKDMVERAARAFYEYPTPGVDVSLRTDWDRLTKASPDVADNYRSGMTAALNAVLGTGEEA